MNKFTYFNIWVKYFVWNFKGYLWNPTQNLLSIHWKILFLYNVLILKALRFTSFHICFWIYFKLCALFRGHWWIQTGVTVQKRPIWVKISAFLSPVSLIFDRLPWKTTRQLFNAILSYVHHLVAMWIKTWFTVWKCPKWDKICFDLCNLDIWPWTFP